VSLHICLLMLEANSYLGRELLHVGGSEEGGLTFRGNGGNIEVDRPSMLLYKSFGTSTNVSLLLDDAHLIDITTRYFARFAGQLARCGLMQPVSTPSVGTATITQDRLVVRQLACHMMAGLLITAALLILATVFFGDSAVILPHSPASIIGIASILAKTEAMFTSLRYHGGAEDAVIRQKLAETNYMYLATDGSGETGSSQLVMPPVGVVDENGNGTDFDGTRTDVNLIQPLALRPFVRIAGILVLVVVISSLEVSLQYSAKNDGLFEVYDKTYNHYLWTILPAVILGSISLFHGSIDRQLRMLTPFLNLQKKATFESSVGLELVGGQWPSIVARGIRHGSHITMVATASMSTLSSFDPARKTSDEANKTKWPGADIVPNLRYAPLIL